MKEMFELIGQASEWLWNAPWYVGAPVVIMLATGFLMACAMVSAWFQD